MHVLEFSVNADEKRYSKAFAYFFHWPDCSEGTFGKDCGGKCLCKNDARCDHVTGTCTCQAGFVGELCEEG